MSLIAQQYIDAPPTMVLFDTVGSPEFKKAVVSGTIPELVAISQTAFHRKTPYVFQAPGSPLHTVFHTVFFRLQIYTKADLLLALGKAGSSGIPIPALMSESAEVKTWQDEIGVVVLNFRIHLNPGYTPDDMSGKFKLT
jgi:hypothetical protein